MRELAFSFLLLEKGVFRPFTGIKANFLFPIQHGNSQDSDARRNDQDRSEETHVQVEQERDSDKSQDHPDEQGTERWRGQLII
jgi:hypothetical protein